MIDEPAPDPRDEHVVERLLEALRKCIPEVPLHATVEIDATILQVLIFDKSTGMVARARMVAASYSSDGRIVAQVQTIH
jgi:hypothetical protein